MPQRLSGTAVRRIPGIGGKELPAAVSSRQAAELLNVGYETLLDAARNGSAPIQPIRIGGALRWPTAEILRVLGVAGDRG